ncbi:MAG: hypothetical protein [Circoviridae sp.]|nr:MAG: hypothetical protein [Circoviridae sp.]
MDPCRLENILLLSAAVLLALFRPQLVSALLRRTVRDSVPSDESSARCSFRNVLRTQPPLAPCRQPSADSRSHRSDPTRSGSSTSSSTAPTWEATISTSNDPSASR